MAARRVIISEQSVEPRKTVYSMYFGYTREELKNAVLALLEFIEEIPDRPAKEFSQFLKDVEELKARTRRAYWLPVALSWASQRKITAARPSIFDKKLIAEEEALNFLRELYAKSKDLFYRYIPMLSRYAIRTKDSWKLSLEIEEVRKDVIENVLPFLQRAIPELKEEDIIKYPYSFGTRQNFHQRMIRRFDKYVTPQTIRMLIWGSGVSKLPRRNVLPGSSRRKNID